LAARGSRWLPVRAVFFVAVLLATAAAGGGEARGASSGFANPVAPQAASGADSPDPWLFVRDGRYFLTYTSADRIDIRTSRSLSGLASARPRTIWAPAAGPPEACCNLWAPELHRLPGPGGRARWYLFYTAGPGDITMQRMHVLQGARREPLGRYRYLGQIDTGARFAIDANVFRAGGRAYLLFSAAPTNVFTPTSLWIGELQTPAVLAREPIEISRPEHLWEMVGMPINEGPQALLHDGLLHVIYSASWCGTGAYKLGRLTVPVGSDLLDPGTWRESKHPMPVFQGSDAAGVYGTGHGNFFTSPDGRESWMTYHATDNQQGCFTGGVRLTHAKPFSWSEDGAPDFGTPPALGARLPRPGGDPSRALQAEDHMRPAAPHSRRIDSRALVGASGLAVSPTRPDGRLGAVRIPGAKPSRVHLGVRVVLDEPRLRLLARRPQGRRLAAATVRGEPGEAMEVRLPGLRLPGSGRRVVLALPRPAEREITFDQIRVTRTRASSGTAPRGGDARS
jgi:GH43 family beta-xylosidase